MPVVVRHRPSHSSLWPIPTRPWHSAHAIRVSNTVNSSRSQLVYRTFCNSIKLTYLVLMHIHISPSQQYATVSPTCLCWRHPDPPLRQRHIKLQDWAYCPDADTQHMSTVLAVWALLVVICPFLTSWLTHGGLVISCGDLDLGQHQWQRPAAWGHLAVAQTNVDTFVQ